MFHHCFIDNFNQTFIQSLNTALIFVMARFRVGATDRSEIVL